MQELSVTLGNHQRCLRQRCVREWCNLNAAKLFSSKTVCNCCLISSPYRISGISVNSNNDGFSDISFRIVDQSRYPEILKLLYANFHPDEPMSRAVGMVDGSKQTNPILDDFALNGLKQVNSIPINSRAV